MIRVIENVDAFWEIDRYDVVLLGCSIYCMIEGGFGGKLKNRFPIIREVDDKTPYADTRKLGTRVNIKETKPMFSLAYICKYPMKKKPTVDYDALEKCLQTFNNEFKGKKVITTILGHSKYDGYGDKDKCLEIMRRCLTDVDVDIYDYRQMSMREEMWRLFEYIQFVGKINWDLNKYMYDRQNELYRIMYCMEPTVSEEAEDSLSE